MFVYLTVVLFGLAVGSFLNVVIWRVPRKKSIVSPASRCPACDTPIKPWDNIPVISYILLQGKCRHCGARISLRYPLVEALNAGLWALMYWRFGLGWHLLAYFVFMSALVAITFIDLDFQIIPDAITLPGIPLGLLAGIFLLPDPMARMTALGWKASLIGAASGFCLYYAVAWASVVFLKQEGMGGGDIKLMTVVGALMGWKSVLLATFLGSLAGSVLGLFLMAFRGRGRKTKIPFGPFLALGALLTLVIGQEIYVWYINAGR